MGISQNVNAYFLRSTSNAPLVIFRIIFGALLLLGSLRFVSKGWVKTLYIDPPHHFTYYGFEWVRDLPGDWMYLPFIACIIASVGILIGFFYRWSALLFFVSFTYIELIDKSYYLNHYYFVSLLSFLLIFLPANRSFSFDHYFHRVQGASICPVWCIDIIKFQIACVYFFAGLAKLNGDWLLDAQPLFTWLQAHHHLPFIGKLFASKETAYIFSWMGCLYDLFIVFALLFAPTRFYAYILVVLFHLMTWLLFPIGIFPWMMIFSTLIFFSPSWHQKVLNQLKGIANYKKVFNEDLEIKPNGFVKFSILCFVLFQVLTPLRSTLYPGSLFWTEEGFRFSWRVMLMHKEGHATFFIKDQKTKRKLEVDASDYLNLTQYDQMVTQPDMILQFAQILKRDYNGKTLIFGKDTTHLTNVSVHANIFVSLNGRYSRKFVDEKHDLSQIPYNLKHREWLEPFK